MATTAPDFASLGLLHEHPALDFVNTTPVHDTLARDHMTSYADLLAWGRDAGLLDEGAVERLAALGERAPSRAAHVLSAAIDLREAFFRALSAIARAETPAQADLDAVQNAATEAMPHLRLEAREGGFVWVLDKDGAELELPYWMAAWSAVELLRSDAVRNVRECGGDTCDWVFLDTSRNHSRRWCDMATCGNRAKARRHYRREKGSPAE